jgi:hypothetical protein
MHPLTEEGQAYNIQLGRFYREKRRSGAAEEPQGKKTRA